VPRRIQLSIHTIPDTMSWIPSAILAKKALDAAIRYNEKQSARFRCRICWTNNHTTEEHLHPQLNARRRSLLVKCRIAIPFFLAAWVGIPAYLIRGSWFQPLVEWLILWPVWAWAMAYRFRKAQRKENERSCERQA
jgi:hypothetical protein